MIEVAEKKITIKTTIIEPTSGNTGIALAFVSATRGYKLILTMPSSMSTERRKMLLFLGAKIVITYPKKWNEWCNRESKKKIHKDTPNSIILDQFENQANPEIHYKTTAQEIWSSVDGQIDSFSLE